jgi:hypothetical protein
MNSPLQKRDLLLAVQRSFVSFVPGNESANEDYLPMWLLRPNHEITKR